MPRMAAPKGSDQALSDPASLSACAPPCAQCSKGQLNGRCITLRGDSLSETDVAEGLCTETLLHVKETITPAESAEAW